MSARLLRIGKDLKSRVEEFFDNSPGPDATPLELLQATLDHLETKVQPAGRGRRVFPYDRILVRIAQPAADRVATEAVFSQLEQRLRDRLAEMKCEAPQSIRAIVSLADATVEEEPLLAVECLNEGGPAASSAGDTSPTPASLPLLKVTVVKGQCVEPEYVFEEPIVRIGRLSEPSDASGHIRINHVAFLDVRDGINETVGRGHATLRFDAESGHYNLFNDGSSNPTSIVRNGRTIKVAPRDPRGVRVQSGDNLQLGRAVLRVTFG